MRGSQRLRIIIAGGGTGGHLYPGLALAEELKRRLDANIVFIGTSYGIESRVLPTTEYGFKKIWMRGLQRKLSLGNLMFPVRLFVSLFQCAYLLLRFRPKVVIGTGGYVAGPILMMAMLFGVSTVIQEQNSFPGLVNRLLGRWADQVHVTYEASLRHFKRGDGVYVSGNPVRSQLKDATRDEALTKFGLMSGKTTLLVFGGSQGARAINDCVLSSVHSLLKHSDLQILWVTGPAEFEQVTAKCNDFQERLATRAFIEDMASAYAVADIALCRAGASTLSEITLCGIPSILVPYPHATAAHQEFNARTLEDAGASIRISESSFNKNSLVSAVQGLMLDSDKRAAMAAAALGLARPDATSNIVSAIEALMGSHLMERVA